jgi:hypothetical protein
MCAITSDLHLCTRTVYSLLESRLAHVLFFPRDQRRLDRDAKFLEMA